MHELVSWGGAVIAPAPDHLGFRAPNAASQFADNGMNGCWPIIRGIPCDAVAHLCPHSSVQSDFYSPKARAPGSPRVPRSDDGLDGNACDHDGPKYRYAQAQLTTELK